MHRGMHSMVPLHRIPITANHLGLSLQWAHEHRSWQTDWQQVVFLYESHFNLLYHDGHFRVRRYAGERCLPECVIERHSGLTNPRSYAQHMQRLPWPAYSPDTSPIEHVWDLVGRRLARDPHTAASKDEFLLRIQEIWNFFIQADIQNLFDSMPRRIATLISACGGYTKY
ncbi:transposable element Tcb2 transposase [Trichonephila clavipes]|nr:transposable element Tcb2 transposase [Trichonephila clavipes]